jgi:hypothetical protein
MLTHSQIKLCQTIGRNEAKGTTTIGLAEFDALCEMAHRGVQEPQVIENNEPPAQIGTEISIFMYGFGCGTSGSEEDTLVERLSSRLQQFQDEGYREGKRARCMALEIVHDLRAVA